MIKICIKKAFTVILLLLSTTTLFAKIIPLNSADIYVTGAAYVSRTPDKLLAKRFSEATLNTADDVRAFNAKTASSTSGIKIQFKTSSSFIHLKFSPEKGLNEEGAFLVLKDGVVFKIVEFGKALQQDFQLNIDSLPKGKASVYDIIMPSYSNFSLTGMELDESSNLLKYTPVKKPILITYGDSITHGRGQKGATYLTYPYIFSQLAGMDLYNVAVGGAKVSIPMAKTLGDIPKASVITVLMGYNDLNGASKSAEQYEKDYREMLTTIRKQQKDAKIFCITMLYTKKQENAKTHFTPDQFRDVVRNIVKEYQKTDKKLYLVEGEKITSLENLQPGEKTDAVHLTVKGADLFGHALYNTIKKDL